MVQLYIQCPNCGSRMSYIKSAAKIPHEHGLHYCNRCGYQNGNLEKTMTCA